MVTEEKRKKQRLLAGLAVWVLVLSAVIGHYLLDPWGFYYSVSPEEAALRLSLVASAESDMGRRESDGSHEAIIDLYNAHEPLAMDYAVQYTDSWCCAFVSAAAIRAGLTEVIPTECSCQRQIGLFQALGCWEEDDNAIPLPGDLIYYDWEQTKPGDAQGWSDHVGIVVGIKWPFVKVIEGNKDDSVGYRYILLGDWQIRGYARPDYASVIENTP